MWGRDAVFSFALGRFARASLLTSSESARQMAYSGGVIAREVGMLLTLPRELSFHFSFRGSVPQRQKKMLERRNIDVGQSRRQRAGHDLVMRAFYLLGTINACCICVLDLSHRQALQLALTLASLFRPFRSPPPPDR